MFNITNHVKENIVVNKESTTKVDQLNASLKNAFESINDLEKRIKSFEDKNVNIQENFVSFSELNELVVDIKESFVSVINSTPRDNIDVSEIRKAIDDLKTQIEVLKQEISKPTHEQQIIEVTPDMKIPKSSKIPKLDLPKKKPLS